ncbi:MAG: dihydroorotate dehydrogenase electron transfer subunit [Sedimentisphaerales bacterium]|nr:dihydroorotate dehydrogenase electron transfer subunit [Sedimentisphaerales bacterium]
MPDKDATAQKGIYTATVLSNRRIRECFYTMDVEFSGEGARTFAGFRPGQFLQIDVSTLALPPQDRVPVELQDASRRSVLLRRPFSFADVTARADKTTAELLYCVLGPASVRMTTLKAGDPLSVLGPLGNGFRVSKNKHTALLVVGGMGAPPIRCLAKFFKMEHPDMKVMAFVGARSAAALPFEGDFTHVSQQMGLLVPAFASLGIPSAVATDDGSAGYRGLVTSRLALWLNEHAALSLERTAIYACGPEPMLSAVARLANERGIECQVSMERRMACGIGVCQSCAVECRVEGSNETIYKLCCQDGPVFDARTVVFGEGGL